MQAEGVNTRLLRKNSRLAYGIRRLYVVTLRLPSN